MKQLKRMMLILLAAAMVFMLTGCGEKPAEEPAAETAARAEESGKTLAERVEAIANDAGKLAPFDADDLADMAGIQAGDYTDFVFLQGDVMEGREILALQAADEAAAEKLAGQMEKYLERRREENRNYAPKAFQELSEAKVERKGLLLVMTILPFILLFLSYILYKKHYILDEPEYDRICRELEARKAGAKQA